MSPSKVSNIDFSTFYNIIDGQQRSSKNTYNGINPATQEKLWDVPIGNQQDINDAVKAALKAFKSWSEVPIKKRHETIRKFIDLFGNSEQQFTDLLCEETGKPRMFANMEVKGVSEWLGYHATLTLPEDTAEDDEKNFPLVLSMGKIAPAVLTGNCIIVKPSPFTPYTALKMVELAQQVFPAGVVQVIGGYDKLGPMLTTHPDIAKISFTGSIATGKKIMEACSKTLKRVTLELGGNDASIVLPDVDIAKTAPEVAIGAFFNSGQACIATKRIYIHESIYKPFIEAMVNFTKNLKVGSSDEAGIILGPIQNNMQSEKVKQFFTDSKKHGYTFAAGKPEVETSKGFFIHPAIIDNPPNDSMIIQEEPFGPIVPCQPWTDEDEVINRANDTNTGLAACVWGKDIAHAERIGMRLQAGSVFINSSEKPTVEAFFSGHKESGIGGEWGKQGMLAYCNTHVMHVYKDKSSASAAV